MRLVRRVHWVDQPIDIVQPAAAKPYSHDGAAAVSQLTSNDPLSGVGDDASEAFIHVILMAMKTKVGPGSLVTKSISACVKRGMLIVSFMSADTVRPATFVTSNVWRLQVDGMLIATVIARDDPVTLPPVQQ